MKITDWFIDADTHITEPGDVWTSRLPARFRERAPRMVRSNEGVDSWQFGRPLSLHIGTGDFQKDLVNPQRFAVHGITPTIVAQSMTVLLQNAIQVLDVAMSGILPRNPHLRVVSVESGIGWIPFVHEALDHGFEYANVRAEKPEFDKKPSEYLRQQVWACTFFEELAPQRLLDVIGADRVMFETDYPHPVCLYGNVREKIDAAPSGHPAEIQRQILFGNAAALYEVAVPDRPPAAAGDLALS